MPKLAAFTSKKIISILKKGGIGVDHISESHYILYNSVTKKV